MKRITAPVPGLNGPGVGGLEFTDSVAETDNDAIVAYCESAGYTVENVDVEPEFPEGDPSLEWTGDQLKAYAKAKDISLGGATNKPDMVKAIEAAPATEPERPADDADVSDWVAYAVAVGLTEDDVDGKTADEVRQFIDDLTELAGQA